jgi:hypothetical protein
MIWRGGWDLSGNQHLPLYDLTAGLVDLLALAACVGMRDNSLKDLHLPWQERRTLRGSLQGGTKTLVCRE